MKRWKKWPASARRFLAGAGGCSSLAFEGALRNRRFPKKVSKMFEKTRWMLQNHGRWCCFWRVNLAIRLPPLSFQAKSTLSQVVFPRQKAQPFPLKNHKQIHSKSKQFMIIVMILSFASPQQMFIFSKQSSHFSQEPRSDSDSQGSVSTDSETSSNKTERTEMAARRGRTGNRMGVWKEIYGNVIGIS